MVGYGWWSGLAIQGSTADEFVKNTLFCFDYFPEFVLLVSYDLA